VRCAQKLFIDKEGLGMAVTVKGCRGTEHGQTCAKDRTGAVALRAALESAVQLGRGDEVNRQAEMANPTKCRDSLQAELPLACERIPRTHAFDDDEESEASLLDRCTKCQHTCNVT
jgi:hypothetical protein